MKGVLIARRVKLYLSQITKQITKQKTNHNNHIFHITKFNLSD